MSLPARVAFLVLVGATFAAFFVAQRLKSSPPVIRVTGVARFWSPEVKPQNTFSVRLKVRDDATVDIVRADGDAVRRLADDTPLRPFQPLRLAWDGRTDAGTRAPDGNYRVRVSLRREGRSVVVQQTIMLDTSPPRPQIREVEPSNVVAAGTTDIRLRVRGASGRYPSTIAIVRTDDGRPSVVARTTAAPGSTRAAWNGLLADGTPAPPGTYLAQVSVRDRAGNVGTTPARIAPGAPGHPGITIRGIAAQPPLRPVVAGSPLTVFVDARGRGYTWRLRRVGGTRVVDRGRGDAARLRLRAPAGDSGVYLLALRAGRFTTTVPILVKSPRDARILVVVPALSWLGLSPVDDPPYDGVPNTLTSGGPVAWPRVLAGPDGLPAFFADQTAPLLAFLDRLGIAYDVTSDLALTVDGAPAARERRGILLAGPERWTTRGLARRLRTYVAAGGHLAMVGADSLRRGVTVREGSGSAPGSLADPTAATATDPFGARLLAQRTTPAPTTLTPTAGPSAPLLTGITELEGFSSFEDSTVTSGRTVTALGTSLERAAITQTRLGRGTVIRVGLPAWGQELGRPPVAQLTANVADILRGAEPRIR